MIFTRKNMKEEDIGLYIEGTEIEKVHVSKFLGIIKDDKLSRRDHVAYISNKIFKEWGLWWKQGNTLIRQLYWIYIIHLFIHIWGQTYDKYIAKISVLQRRIIRIIAGVNRRTNTDIYYKKIQIVNVKQINMYVICLFMYRFHHYLLPEVFDHYFTLNRNVHAYDTRQRQLLHVPPLSL